MEIQPYLVSIIFLFIADLSAVCDRSELSDVLNLSLILLLGNGDSEPSLTSPYLMSCHVMSSSLPFSADLSALSELSAVLYLSLMWLLGD